MARPQARIGLPASIAVRTKARRPRPDRPRPEHAAAMKPKPSAQSPKAPDSAKPHSADELETYSFDAMSEDPPDPLIGDVVDVEAIISEFLTLALDPYPQKPGAKFIDPTRQEAAAETSPFAMPSGRPGMARRASQ